MFALISALSLCALTHAFLNRSSHTCALIGMLMGTLFCALCLVGERSPQVNLDWWFVTII